MRRLYGAGPLHLLGHLALGAVAVIALGRILGARGARDALVWLLCAALVHDLLLLPAYSLVDRAAGRVARGAINYVRVPAVIAGVLLLVYFPVVLGKGEANRVRASGFEPGGRATAWVAIAGGLALVSAAVLVVRRRRVDQLHDPVRAAGDGHAAGG